MKVKSNILNKEFDFTVNHLGLFVSDELNLLDKYIVTIEDNYFEYSQGIGFRIPNVSLGSVDRFKKLMNRNPKREKENLRLFVGELERCSKVKPLVIDDILNSLLIDCQFSLETFEDFCDGLGYSQDSMRAFEIYRGYQKNAKKVKAFINNINEAFELFQDY